MTTRPQDGLLGIVPLGSNKTVAVSEPFMVSPSTMFR